MNPHNHIIAIDRPGIKNRRWKCKMCNEVGLCDDLVGPKQKNDCGYAADCSGVLAALSSPNVRVIS